MNYFPRQQQCHICKVPPVMCTRMQVLGRGRRVALEVEGGRGTSQPDWLTICLWDRADVWVEQAICASWFNISPLCLYVCCCDCLHVYTGAHHLVCVPQRACVWRYTLWLALIPWGLVVVHMEWVSREQVHIIIKSCLVIVHNTDSQKKVSTTIVNFL